MAEQLIYTYHGEDGGYYSVKAANTSISGSVEIASKWDDKINGEHAVKIIEKNAFEDCRNFISITIPESVIRMELHAFLYCAGLKKVYIKSIESWCNIDFAAASSTPLGYAQDLYLNEELITNLTIPNSVKSIGSWVFYGCSSLKSVTIPNSVTSIGYEAFRQCTNLTNIIIPESVTKIDYGAFKWCNNLTIYCEAASKPNKWNSNWDLLDLDGQRVTVNWGYNNIIYNEYSYVVHDNQVYLTKYKGDNTEIEIPSIIDNMSVISIGNIFEGNTTITNIIISNNILIIRESAFENCSALLNITIPNSITNIKDNAFNGCNNLTKVNIDNIENWCKIKFASFYSNPLNFAHNLYLNEQQVTNLIIPNSVTNIESYAFSGCNSLASIIISNRIEVIGSNAFKDCDNLTIYCEAESKPSGWASNWNPNGRPIVWGYTSMSNMPIIIDRDICIKGIIKGNSDSQDSSIKIISPLVLQKSTTINTTNSDQTNTNNTTSCSSLQINNELNTTNAKLTINAEDTTINNSGYKYPNLSNLNEIFADIKKRLDNLGF